MPTRTISINRAPVLTLWAAVVAQRLGFSEDEALTLGKAVAGLNAQAIWMLDMNGLPMDIRRAPREAQVVAFEKGLIPYIPADSR